MECIEQTHALYEAHKYFNGSGPTGLSGNVLQTSFPSGGRDGPFVTDDYVFKGACSETGVWYPMTVNATGASAAVVVKVSQMTSTSALAPTRLYISGCDGKLQYNVTAPGTFVVKGKGAYTFVQRAPARVGANQYSNITDCAGDDRITYSVETIENHCLSKQDQAKPECAGFPMVNSLAPASTPISPSSSSALSTLTFTAGVTGLSLKFALPRGPNRDDDRNPAPLVDIADASIVVNITELQGLSTAEVSYGNYGVTGGFTMLVQPPPQVGTLLVVKGQRLSFGVSREMTSDNGTISFSAELIGDFCKRAPTEKNCQGHNEKATSPPASGKSGSARRLVLSAVVACLAISATIL